METNQQNITIERIDDIFLLIFKMKKIGIPDMLDLAFPGHGNWKGLSLGWVVTIWCTHIMSEADHCLDHVRPWAASRLELLQQCCGQPVTELDFTDDRLALILQRLNSNQPWFGFENTLSQNVLRVYKITRDIIRLDTTTTYKYCGITPGGLFQFGHSKDYRPDLPQLKIMMSTTDHGGFPLVTTTVSGEKADDPLYIPAIKQVREGLQQQGLLFVGDTKMSSIENRAFIVAGKDKYLCPLSRTQVPKDELDKLLEPVWAKKQALIKVYATDEENEPLVDDEENPIQIVEGFELTVSLSAEYDEKKITWDERRLVVRSLAIARSGTKKLKTKVEKGLALILDLNKKKQGKKCYRDIASLEAKTKEIQKQYGITDLLKLSYKEEISERHIRGYKGKAPRIEVDKKVFVSACVDEEALKKAMRRLGWRVYCTNAESKNLSFEEGVKKYRANYPIEGSFRRLKGKPLSIQPMFLQLDFHIVGLIRLLSICLKVLVLLEFVVRDTLKKSKEPLREIYAGNPTRETMRPSAGLILRLFKEIFLICINVDGQIEHRITPLSSVQQRILKLLGFSIKLYEHPASYFKNASDNHDLEET